MTVWGWVLLASLVAFATKVAGHLLPREQLEKPWLQVAMSAMTIGLLTGLVVNNTIGQGRELVIDARLLSLIAAVVALRFKAPFIVVVLVGAATAATARLLGIG